VDILVRKWIDEHAISHAEHSGGGAYAEGKRENCSDGKTGISV
jgi:hypothetical protein